MGDWRPIAQSLVEENAALRAQLADERVARENSARGWEECSARMVELEKQLAAAEARVAEARRKAFEEALNVVRAHETDWCGQGNADRTHWDILHYDIVPNLEMLASASPVVIEPPTTEETEK